jgi:hypothetical protein
MIAPRARQAGIKTRVGNYSMPATAITDYLRAWWCAARSGRPLFARAPACHTALDESEKVGI